MKLICRFSVLLKWTSDGLVPAIVQDSESGEVLMMAWMDEPAIRQTLATGQTHFYFQVPQGRLAQKGGPRGTSSTSSPIAVDCDTDVLLNPCPSGGGGVP